MSSENGNKTVKCWGNFCYLAEFYSTNDINNSSIMNKTLCIDSFKKYGEIYVNGTYVKEFYDERTDCFLV